MAARSILRASAWRCDGRVGSEQGEFMKKLNALKTGRRWQMKGALGLYVSGCFSRQKPGEHHRPNTDFPSGHFLCVWPARPRSDFFLLVEPQFMQIRVNAIGNYSADETNSLFQDVERAVMDVRGVASMSAWNFPLQVLTKSAISLWSSCPKMSAR